MGPFSDLECYVESVPKPTYSLRRRTFAPLLPLSTTMVLPIARLAAGRRLASQAVRHQQRRNMGHGPKPEWTGIDKTVRDVLPEDWQSE